MISLAGHFDMLTGAAAAGATVDARFEVPSTPLPPDDCHVALQIVFKSAGIPFLDPIVPAHGLNYSNREAVAKVLEADSLDHEIVLLASWLPVRIAADMKIVRQRQVLRLVAVFTKAVFHWSVVTPGAMQRLGDLWAATFAAAAGSGAATLLKNIRGLVLDLPTVDEPTDAVACAQTALVFLTAVLPDLAAVLATHSPRWTLPQLRDVLESCQRAVQAACMLASSELPALKHAVAAAINRPVSVRNAKSLHVEALTELAPAAASGATGCADGRPATALGDAGSAAISSACGAAPSSPSSVMSVDVDSSSAAGSSAAAGREQSCATAAEAGSAGAASLPAAAAATSSLVRDTLLPSALGALATITAVFLRDPEPGQVRRSAGAAAGLPPLLLQLQLRCHSTRVCHSSISLH